eukprot:jgi/Bigna1/84901/estExt_fgenesh1_pg.C_10323
MSFMLMKTGDPWRSYQAICWNSESSKHTSHRGWYRIESTIPTASTQRTVGSWRK